MITLSSILGWSYTAAWTASFYPQLLLNYQRRSVAGLSIDFLALNVLGFLCYATFNIVLLSSSTVRDEYRLRNGGADPLVHLNDVAFASHALVISLLTLLQSFIYKRDLNQRLSKLSTSFILLSLATVFISTIAASVTDRLGYLDLIYLLSYIKLGISFAKYVPQALLNYRRRSTVGWSIANILLDLTGGSLSLSQLVWDSYLANGVGILENPGKLGLSILSITFDLLFIVQHFILYRNVDGVTEDGETGAERERSRLLGDASSSV